MNTPVRFDFIPPRMRSRPIDHRGFPVPWFVSNKTHDGLWDFVALDAARLDMAFRMGLCTLSGEPLGRHVAFVVGPMCIINRVAAEPPCIPELGEWAAQVCPFMSRPLAKRLNVDASTVQSPPGIMVADNPGGCVVWTVKRTDFERDKSGLYHFGDPTSVTWWTKGRKATPDEARALFAAWAAKLEAMASEEGDGALRHFYALRTRAERFVNFGTSAVPLVANTPS